MKKLTVLLALLLFSVTSFAQNDKMIEKTFSKYVNPEEIISLSEGIPFDKAIEMLSKVSVKLTGKKIVSLSTFVDPIGIEIDKMPYWKALNIIVQYNNLVYIEEPEVIVIKDKSQTNSDLDENIYASINAKEVRISALIFSANVNDLRERGINWEVLFSKDGYNVGGGVKTFLEGQQTTDDGSGSSSSSGQSQDPPDFTFGLPQESEFQIGNWTGKATALFKFFESEDMGEVLANPTITVRNKTKGRVQIGQDISIKQRDFSGNVTDVFVSVGTIVEVTPYVYNEEGIDYILLKVKLERSSGQPSDVSTIIDKTQAETEILLTSGEEAVLGGLFETQTKNIRRGIPFLKDLPWWVFGIKYLTGYEQDLEIKKETVMLLKVDLVPSIKDRINQKKADHILKDELDRGRGAIQEYRNRNEKETDDEE